MNRFFRKLIYFKLFGCIIYLYSHPLAAQLSHNINIFGTIEGYPIQKGKASLIPMSLGLDCIGYAFDSISVSIINNKFHFSGTMPYPHGFEAIYMNDGKKYAATSNFFLDSGTIYIVCYFDSIQPQRPKIIGSNTNHEYLHTFLPGFIPIQNILEAYLNARTLYNKQYNGNMPDSIKTRIKMIRKEYLLKRDSYFNIYIRNHPASYIPLSFIGQGLERLPDDIFQIEKTFNLLGPAQKTTVSGKKINKIISFKKYGAISDSLKVAEFTNTKSSLQKFPITHAQYTLVDFWFSDCKPCIAQLPQLIALYTAYKSKGFEIIGISVDSDKTQWLKSLKKYRLRWINFLDEQSVVNDKLLISSYPSNLLLDKEFKIVKKDISLSELKSLLQNL